jgi:hypothetical protein
VYQITNIINEIAEEPGPQVDCRGSNRLVLTYASLLGQGLRIRKRLLATSRRLDEMIAPIKGSRKYECRVEPGLFS